MKTSEIFDPGPLAELRTLDPDGSAGLVADLVNMFKASAARTITEMQAAIASGEAQTLAETAHSMKSSSGNLGACGISRLCAELEQLGMVNSRELNTKGHRLLCKLWRRKRPSGEAKPLCRGGWVETSSQCHGRIESCRPEVSAFSVGCKCAHRQFARSQQPGSPRPRQADFGAV